MKRLGTALCLLAILLSLFVPALAADSAQRIDAAATVQTDGSCTVQLQLRLHLDQPADQVILPLPGSAGNISVNNGQANTKTENQRVLVVLPAMVAGDHTISLQYTLSGVVDPDKGLLSLPLLSGIPYSIASMEFHVTLPETIDAAPTFTSGYHQQGIRDQIILQISENTLHGYLTTPLKDHETLLLELPVEAAWFTQPQQDSALLNPWDLAIAGCLLLACLYFVVTLLPRYPRLSRCCTAPEGISAGQVGTCLTGCGTDLTLLVITWAQLGYLSIKLDARGRVLLYKRMQMGNERSAAENRWFQQLFGSRNAIDGTGTHYALLCRKVAAQKPTLQLYAPRSGNRWIFRTLCCAAGILSGIRMGLLVQAGPGPRTLAMLALGGLMAILSYFLQSGGKCLPLRDKTPLWMALGCGAVWIGLGLLTGRTAGAVLMVLVQLLSGVAAAYGGKRSELGKRSMAQMLSLRKHMVSAAAFDLQQMMQKNPNYFYELAPYALAMGVDRKFARRFGKEPLPEDSYLELGHHRQLTAAQWAAQLRRAADILNKRQKRLPYQRLLGK